jgi:hypothetical protein
VTGGDVAAAALQKNAAMMSVVARVIAPVHFTFVIAMWRAKGAESPRELLGNYARNRGRFFSGTRAG